MDNDKNTLDPNEAPIGFYAEIKPKFNPDLGNICRQCDARPLCIEDANDWCINNRCMSYPIICTKTGDEIARKDGCSVVFKKIK